MIQRGGGARFLFEAAQAIGISRGRRQQDLERHVAAEPRIVGAIDLAHSACADEGDNFVRSEFRARSEVHPWARL
jgi:hypothetical protein